MTPIQEAIGKRSEPKTFRLPPRSDLEVAHRVVLRWQSSWLNQQGSHGRTTIAICIGMALAFHAHGFTDKKMVIRHQWFRCENTPKHQIKQIW